MYRRNSFKNCPFRLVDNSLFSRHLTHMNLLCETYVIVRERPAPALCNLLSIAYMARDASGFYKCFSITLYSTINSVPAPISTHPTTDLTVNSSCRNTNASTIVSTTLSLSTGTTFDASPSCRAR